MNRIISISPSDTSLAGKYAGGDTVLVKCDATDGAFTVALPDAVNAVNVLFIVKKMDSGSNAVTITGINGQTIEGESSKALSSQYVKSQIISDGQNWQIIN